MAEAKCPSNDLKYQRLMMDKIEGTLAKMRLEGIPELSTPFRTLTEARQRLLTHFGFKFPRGTYALIRLFGLSPGEVKLWFDEESGYFTEARAKEGAPPVYKHVSDEVAMTILKGELTHELEAELMTPDEYIGE